MQDLSVPTTVTSVYVIIGCQGSCHRPWREIILSHLHPFEHVLFPKQEAVMGHLLSLFWELDPPPMPLSFSIPSQDAECRKDGRDDSCGTVGSFLLWYFVVILILMFFSRASVWVGNPFHLKSCLWKVFQQRHCLSFDESTKEKERFLFCLKNDAFSCQKI